jgi:hypothetical protein
MDYRTKKRAVQTLARILLREDLEPEERANALRQWAEAHEPRAHEYRAYAGGTSPHGVSALKAGKLRRVRRAEGERG